MTADAPETMAQARAFQKVNAQALRFGLCPTCAAQIAWGTQLGFARTTREPCQTCTPLVALLPVAKPGGWRTVVGRAANWAPWAACGRVDRYPSPAGLPAPGSAVVPSREAASVSRWAA